MNDQRTTHSQNSSKPPSSDSPSERKQRPAKKSSGRQRGGQPSHKGHYRRLHAPEEVEPELHAPVALLSAQFHQSDRMIQTYLQTFYSLPVSLGVISEMQGRITPWLWPLAKAVRDYLR